MEKFRKKPVEIEAIQFNGNSNKQEVEAFIGRELKSELESETAYVAGKGAPIFSLLIETKEGIMKAFQNDWIIKEPFPTGDRDFYPCKPDIFEKTYERISPPLDAQKEGMEKETEGKSETLIVRVTVEMKEALQELADKSRRTLCDYVRLLIEDKINESKVAVTPSDLLKQAKGCSSVKFLLDSNCDDLILNDRMTTAPQERIYASDIMTRYAELLSLKEDKGALDKFIESQELILKNMMDNNDPSNTLFQSGMIHQLKLIINGLKSLKQTIK